MDRLRLEEQLKEAEKKAVQGLRMEGVPAFMGCECQLGVPGDPATISL